MNAQLRRLILALACLAIAPGHAQPPAGKADDPLTLDEAAIKDAGIVVDTLRPRAMSESIAAPGEVKVDAYSTVLVSPRIAAQVVARQAKLGDVVTAGTPLVELSSVEVAETQGQLLVASQDWQRVSALGPQAVSARRYNEALVARDQARAKLRAYGLSEGQIGRVIQRGSAAADGRFALLAPHAGRITTDDFLVGQRVEPGRTLFTLVTEDSVWVEARLSPAAAKDVKPGDMATVMAHGAELPGTVLQRSHQTDETTRTVAIRIRVGNRDDLLHPGELVESRIAIGKPLPRLAVPAEAVLLLQDQPTVFVRRGAAGRFEAVAVETEPAVGGWTPIRQGLRAGDTYVSKGAFALKARLLRSQLGED
ncbi:efflux RND transporter periplasmic adaptor subunit [Luteibacter yeojuensis]